MNAQPKTRAEAIRSLEKMLYQAVRNNTATEFGYRLNPEKAEEEAERIKARIKTIEGLDNATR